MRKFILAGLALSAAIIAMPPPAKAQIFAWCRHESLNGLRCYWDTWDQCRQSEQRGMGGSCFRNPAYRGPDPGSVQPAARAKYRSRPRYGSYR
jgi:Protein of unknown function (DUF3551)